jgi:hypothetical protein
LETQTALTLKEVEKQSPNKWDIIPLHTSDRETFKYCRRRWNWSSPARENLIPRAQVYGIQENLWYGTGIHFCLEKYYDPIMQEDPTAVWIAWFDMHVKGGEVTFEDIERHGLADRNPTRVRDNVYSVDGLEDIVPFYDEEKFDYLRDLGIGMMNFYKEYAQANDDFRTVGVEHQFSVPVLDPKGAPLYMPDTRQMPENWEPNLNLENYYGPLMKYSTTKGLVKQVHARGRMDKVIQENTGRGRFGLHDYKTASRIDDDYFRHLDMDEQFTTYLWAIEREAEMFDLEFKDVEFLTVEAILKAYPKPPTILKSGLPSINRAEESTTAAMFEETIDVLGIRMLFDNDLKMQNYYTWLLEKGDDRFVNRTDTWRNKMQRKNAGIRLYYEAIDMLSNPRLYPSPRKEYKCINCQFRAPCIAAEDGSDYKSMLKDGYTPNWDR